jgi:hypothetical protein
MDSVHGEEARARTAPPVGRCADRTAGFPRLTRTYQHTNSKYQAYSRDFQPAPWPVVPAPAGTMARCAGPCRHGGPSCRPDRVAVTPGCVPLRILVRFPGSRPARTSEAADRTSESDRRLDREPPRRPVSGLGMWQGTTASGRSPRGRPWRAGWRAPPTTPAPARSLIPDSRITWEYFGSREDSGYPDAQTAPRSPNPPRYEAPQRARASRQPHVPASRPGNARSTRGRHLASAGLTGRMPRSSPTPGCGR